MTRWLELRWYSATLNYRLWRRGIVTAARSKAGTRAYANSILNQAAKDPLLAEVARERALNVSRA